jgi:hypothetical protein
LDPDSFCPSDCKGQARGEFGMTMITEGQGHIPSVVIALEPEVPIEVREMRTAIQAVLLLTNRRTQALKKNLQRFDHLFS